MEPKKATDTDTPPRARSAGQFTTKEPLQIRIPTDIKRQFKACAAIRGMEPNELFVEVWRHYEQSKG